VVKRRDECPVHGQVVQPAIPQQSKSSQSSYGSPSLLHPSLHAVTVSSVLLVHVINRPHRNAVEHDAPTMVQQLKSSQST
jgi:hypothetical protein